MKPNPAFEPTRVTPLLFFRFLMRAAQFERYAPKIPMIMQILAIVSLAFVISCAPIPHTERSFPEIEGAATFSDSPASKLNVYIEYSPYSYKQEQQPCALAEFVTTTDEQGAFHIMEKSTFSWVVYLGDRSPQGRVCIEHNGTRYIGYSYSVMGSPPRRIKLRCDLSKRPTDVWSQKGFCEAYGA